MVLDHSSEYIQSDDLTHLCGMEFQTIINWTSTFSFYGLLGVIFYIFSKFDRKFCKTTVEILIRRHILQRLICVCTVLPMFHNKDVVFIGVKNPNGALGDRENLRNSITVGSA